ncbi:MAG: glycosyltransferase [bacterium]
MTGSRAAQPRVYQVLVGLALRGAEVHAIRLATRLSECGVAGGLIFNYDHEPAADARARGLEVHVVPKHRRGDPTVIPRLAATIRRLRADLVHTHLVNGNFFGRLASLFVPGLSVISTVHNYGDALVAVRNERERRFIYQQDIWTSVLADRVIAVTESLRDRLVADGMPPARVVAILNGVDTERFDPARVRRGAFRAELGIAPQTCLLASAGRLVPPKGFDRFLEVVAGLRQRGVDAAALILGDGPERERLLAQAQSLGLGARVFLPGYRDDLEQVYADIDGFVLCSETETTSLVTLEAMAMEKPVAVWAVGSLPEVLVGESAGFLVPHGNVGGLVDAVARFAADPARAADMGRAGRGIVEARFSERAQIAATVAVYRDALARRGKRFACFETVASPTGG